MGRAAAGAVLGAALVAGLNDDRRQWARGAARRVARRCGAFGDTRVATKLLLKKAAGCLDANGVPFLLAGGGACWAHGGPFPKDFDLFVAPADAGRALAALRAGGFRIVRRPEEWLFQAYEHGLKIDVVSEPAGLEIGSEVFARAARLGVDGVEMRVLCLEDVFVTRPPRGHRRHPVAVRAPHRGRPRAPRAGRLGRGRDEDERLAVRALVPDAPARPGRHAVAGAPARTTTSASCPTLRGAARRLRSNPQKRRGLSRSARPVDGGRSGRGGSRRPLVTQQLPRHAGRARPAP